MKGASCTKSDASYMSPSMASLDVGVLLGQLAIAVHGRESGNLLAGLVVDQRDGSSILLGLVLREPVGRARSEEDAQQDPGRALRISRCFEHRGPHGNRSQKAR
jgi:hypothetical protein